MSKQNSEVLLKQLSDLLNYNNLPKSADNPTRIRQTRIQRDVTDTKGLFDQTTSESQKELALVHNAVWLEWDPTCLTKKNRFFWNVKRIGYWGQCRALGVLCAFVPSATPDEEKDSFAPLSHRQLADRILAHARARSKTFPGDDYLSQHELEKFQLRGKNGKGLLSTTPDQLGKLLECLLHTGPSSGIVPPREISRILRDAVVAYMWDAVQGWPEYTPRAGISADGLIRRLDSTDHADPAKCFWDIVDHIDLRTAFTKTWMSSGIAQNGLTWLEPNINEYVRTEEATRPNDDSDGIGELVSKVSTCLSHDGAFASRIAVLYGPPFSGKRAVVGDFLRTLRAKKAGDDIGLTCFDPSTGITQPKLPVLCLQTRDFDEISLSVRVLAFLERLDAVRRGKPVRAQDDLVRERELELQRSGGLPGLQVFLDQIRALHDLNKALFVFMDVRDNANTDIRFMIQRNSVKQLVETLFDSNPNSRFLLTTRTMDKPTPEGGLLPDDYLRQHNHTAIETSQASYARLRWYIAQKQLGAFDAAARDTRFSQVNDELADGNLLMLLSILYAQPQMRPDEFFAFLVPLIEKEKKATVLAKTADKLLEFWQDEGLLPHIQLVLAADDGMMPSTMKACIKTWRGQTKHPHTLRPQDAEHRLKELAQLGRGLFLTFREPTDFFAEEVRFDEPRFEQNRDHYRVFEMDAYIGNELRKAIWARGNKEHMRVAYRLVSNEARSRARYRGLRGTSIHHGFQQKLPERSLQSFITLMLSLPPPDTTETPERPDCPLDLATPYIFTIDKTKFDQTLALQYAYRVILRAEADRGHALSMLHDADLLRLRLYTLLCANPGTVGYWDPVDYPRKRDVLPSELQHATLKHFDGVFSITEQSDILTALALSAFYTQHFKILRWAEYRLRALLGADTCVKENLSRVIAARTDLECLIGRGFKREYEEKGRKKGHKYGLKTEKGLTYVRTSLAKDMALLCGDWTWERLTQSQGSDPLAKVTEPGPVLAFFRLQPRWMTLRSLIEPDYDPAEDVLTLRKLETQFVTQRPDQTSCTQHGRTGRLLLRLETGAFPIFAQRSGAGWLTSYDRPDWLEKMKTLVHANVSRLSEYSGSERILTMLEHARHLMLKQDLPSARNAVTEARRLCYASGASDNVRLETLQLETTVLMADLERRVAEGRGVDAALKELVILQQKLEFLREISRAYGLDLFLFTVRLMVKRWLRLVEACGLRADIGTAYSRLKTDLRLDLNAMSKTHDAAGLQARFEAQCDHLRQTPVQTLEA